MIYGEVGLLDGRMTLQIPEKFTILVQDNSTRRLLLQIDTGRIIVSFEAFTQFLRT